jgi:hypothetical protein
MGSRGLFSFPGSTGGARGAAAMSRSRGSDEDEAHLLRRLEVEASYNSAQTFGMDELSDPRELRNVLLHSLGLARYQQQAASEPVAVSAPCPERRCGRRRAPRRVGICNARSEATDVSGARARMLRWRDVLPTGEGIVCAATTEVPGHGRASRRAWRSRWQLS